MYILLRCWQKKHVLYFLWRSTKFYSRAITISHLRISHKASSILKPAIFADHTNLLLSNKDIKKLFNDMNLELQKMSIWFKASKLSLNLTETKWALFHSQKKKRLIASNLPIIYIDNS